MATSMLGALSSLQAPVDLHGSSLFKPSHQDMSRRKQRNPKAIMAAGEEEDLKKEPQDDSDEDSRDLRDASSLVKVELDQTTTDEDELNSSQEGRTTSPSFHHHRLLPGVEEVMKKWNMFQFGEVVVPNHPGLPVVPMALQMVYLYPMSRRSEAAGEVRYRMLVPMQQQPGPASPPLFAAGVTNMVSGSPSPPAGGMLMPHVNLPGFPPDSGVPAVGAATFKTSVAQDQLALDPAQPGPSSAKRPTVADGDGTKSSPPLDLTNKSPDKEDNSIKQQQQRFFESHISLIKIKELELLKNAASATAAAVAVAAAATSNGNQNAATNHRCNECNINFTKYQNYLAHKKYYCSGVKQLQKQQHDSDDQEMATAGSIEQLPPPPPPKCKSPRGGERLMTRDLLLKQQEALLAGMKSTPMPLLIPNPRLPLPPPSAHFVCEGCGIRFKSISNLQAHQSRYCSGIKKTEELRFLEALLKAGHNPAGLSPTDMVAMLAARQAAETAATATTPIKSEVGLTSPPPPTGHKSPSPAAATSPRGGSLAAADSEDFCCILCGLKEASLDKLKDHINMHFIGQVKKRKVSEEPIAQPQQEAEVEVQTKRIKKEETAEQEERKEEKEEEEEDEVKEKEKELRCEDCGIVFSQPTTFAAHRQYYCQSRRREDQLQ